MHRAGLIVTIDQIHGRMVITSPLQSPSRRPESSFDFYALQATTIIKGGYGERCGSYLRSVGYLTSRLQRYATMAESSVFRKWCLAVGQ